MLDTESVDDRDEFDVTVGADETLGVSVKNIDDVATTDADATDAEPDQVREAVTDTLGLPDPVIPFTIDMVAFTEMVVKGVSDGLGDTVSETVREWEDVIVPETVFETHADGEFVGDAVPVVHTDVEAVYAADVVNTADIEYCTDFELEGLDDGEGIEVVDTEKRVVRVIVLVTLVETHPVVLADHVELGVNEDNEVNDPLDDTQTEELCDTVPE